VHLVRVGGSGVGHGQLPRGGSLDLAPLSRRLGIVKPTPGPLL
jgi:hypothetical protein